MTWRPLPPPDGRDARPLGVSLERIASRLGLARPSLLGSVFGHWEELVGADVAAHATPRSLNGGVLTVSVDHPAWATSLRMLSGDLLGRIASGAGEDPAAATVTELRVTVEGAQRRRGREPRR